MNKRLYNYLFLLACCLTVTGCINDDTDLRGPADESRTMEFSIFTVDENVIGTRATAIGETDITNMHVLVFDENGNFISRTEAYRRTTPGSYEVTLMPTDQQQPTSKRKRVVHFIANYDWSGFSDTSSVGKHENEVVAPLSVSGGQIIYWQRLELSNGITKNAFPSVIELIRNVAKISVNNNSAGGSGSNPYLIDATFAIGQYIDQGTVAPFNTTTLAFEEGVPVESPFGDTKSVRETDFIETGSGYYWGTPIYCYEKKNTDTKDPMYIIIKGRYSTSQNYTYYKIDILGSGRETLYDIVRNSHYKVLITDVTGPGRATLLEAMSSPASNNLLYSIVLEDYTSITDGVAVLNVETTVKTLVESAKEFRVGFSYFPSIGRVEDNTDVVVELDQSSVPSEQVISSYSVVSTAGNAHIVATTAAINPHRINSARFIISVVKQDGGLLRRVVRLHLRTPIVFGGLTVSPTTISATVGSEVEISFNVPNTIMEQTYPFPVFVTTNYLTPNMAPGKDDDLSLDYQIPGKYRYAYMVHHPGDHVIHFKTNSNGFTEQIKIESELFSTEQRQITAL